MFLGNDWKEDRQEQGNAGNWLADLVQEELKGTFPKNVGESFALQVEESALSFLKKLHEILSDFVRRLNICSEKGTRFSEVRLYQLAQTTPGFMLFRHQFKLVFSYTVQGVIRIEWTHHPVAPWVSVGGPAEVRPSQLVCHELLVQLGVFQEVFWTLQGERVFPHQVAQYFFRYFCAVSRTSSMASSGRQVLLEHLQTVLNQKRLEPNPFHGLTAIQGKV